MNCFTESMSLPGLYDINEATKITFDIRQDRSRSSTETFASIAPSKAKLGKRLLSHTVNTHTNAKATDKDHS